MSPTPKTTFLRAAASRGHFTQASARCRNSAKAAALASELSAGNAAGRAASPGGARENIGFTGSGGGGAGLADGPGNGAVAGLVAGATGRGACSPASVSGETGTN